MLMLDDRFYYDYYESKLDLIFNENGQTIRTNTLYHPADESVNGPVYESEANLVSYGRSIEPAEAYKMNPDLRKYSDSISSVIMLDNGIYGVNDLKQGTYDYYFPQLNAHIKYGDHNFATFKNGLCRLGDYLFDKEMRVINVHQGDREVSFKPLTPDYVLVIYNNGKYNTYNLVDGDGKLYNDKIEFTEVSKNKFLTILQVGDFYNAGENHEGRLELNKKEKMVKVLLYSGGFLNDGQIFNKAFITEGGSIIAMSDKDVYLFDENGKSLIDGPCPKISVVHTYEGTEYYRLTDSLGKEKAINKQGEVFGNNSFKWISLINDEYGIVSDEQGNRIIDKDGNVIHDNKNKKYDDVEIKNNCIFIDKKGLAVVKKGKLKDYIIKRTLTGYTCKSKDDSFNIKYMPLMKYSDSLVLCINNWKDIFMYNIKEKTYKKVAYYKSVIYDETFVSTYNGELVFLPYKEEMLFITPYFNTKLRDKKELKINEDVGEILTPGDFAQKYGDKVTAFNKPYEEENEIIRTKQKAIDAYESKKRVEEQEKERELLQTKRQELILQEQVRKQEETQRKVRERKESLLKQMSILFDEYEELGEDEPIVDRIIVKDLYDTVGDHLEIKPEYVKYLRIIDLSKETFANVKMCDLNFRRTNVSFDPQVVYKKEELGLKGSDFSKVFIWPFANFEKVNVIGTTLTYDDDPRTIDSFNQSLLKSIHDDTTTINGKTVEEFFEKIEQNKTTKK